MREINYTHNGGLPFSQNVAAFMQGTYALQFGALAGLLGDRVIISGVEVSGGNVSAGWITSGGMLIPFEAGLAADRVDVITSTSDLLYEDGQNKQVYTTRVARCVTVGGFAFSELRRLSSYRSLMDMLTPPGLISMWSGTTPPAGWALCDGGGSPARPDLRGRFVVGHNPTEADYSQIGNIGGANTVSLTALQNGPHSHSTTLSRTKRGEGNAPNHAVMSPGGNEFGGRFTLSVGTQGNGDPHENRPPYYVLAYIIKL